MRQGWRRLTRSDPALNSSKLSFTATKPRSKNLEVDGLMVRPALCDDDSDDTGGIGHSQRGRTDPNSPECEDWRTIDCGGLTRITAMGVLSKGSHKSSKERRSSTTHTRDALLLAPNSHSWMPLLKLKNSLEMLRAPTQGDRERDNAASKHSAPIRSPDWETGRRLQAT